MGQMTTASTVERDLLSGLLWTVGYTTGAMVAGGSELFGIQVGDKDVIYQTRTYGGTVEDLTIELYEDDWTGGVVVEGSNRNLGITLPGPVEYASGVTGTPTTLRTGIKFYSSGVGSASVGVIPEGEWYMLEANTMYILKIINAGSVNGVANFRWTYRAVP